MKSKVKGMPTYLPSEVKWWQKIERAFLSVLERSDYEEIRLRYIERSSTFNKKLGVESDIIRKEMYGINYRGTQDLVLRPEGTASCIAALEENKLLSSKHKLWYYGPMFRHEKPQKGRYRSFYQLGIENFNYDSFIQELEVIDLSWQILKVLGLSSYVQLHVNYLGSRAEQQLYSTSLQNYCLQNDALSPEIHYIAQHNPLRLLDQDDDTLNNFLSRGPQLADAIQPSESFTTLISELKKLAIPLLYDQKLVRGLDYYSGTVCEWKTTHIDMAQNSLGGGGRYDEIIGQNRGFGIGIGIDRILLLVQSLLTSWLVKEPKIIYVAVITPVCYGMALILKEHIMITSSYHVIIDLVSSEKKSVDYAFKKNSAFMITILNNNKYNFTVQPSYFPLKKWNSLTYGELLSLLSSEI